ncbi:uncharacterized protein E0L32_009222 [Thyridium curvatum]|uniref:Zn(2)-C6 fungal-type domain-containing protein n=1 Tax=Thyridium curvatum TaxID=1093900 RepID=A0A507AXH2_9PEZI|nr:uncharacterized protein E0L32_009222 [Thyridium curvatum]TPX09621.1 hypothetical protein E0L32_009222 [Thyridium curvatum]
MVYCGKPSRGCQMCRTRRIKCDETKPTCKQCAKSRRQCPGYKDEFDLVFRNETQATERRAQKASRKPSASKPHSSYPTAPAADTARRSSTEGGGPGLSFEQAGIIPVLGQHPEELAACHFVANFVLVPRQGSTRGFMDYLIPLLKQQPVDSPVHRAFNACAIASLGNRVASEAFDFEGKALGEYVKALSATHAAIKDPVLSKDDGVLAAVLLLGLFESSKSITAKQMGLFAWGSHTEGAVQLVKSRGREQLRTKTGLLLFIAVRTQMIIQTLASSKAPTMGVEWWLTDAVHVEVAGRCQRLCIKVAEIRAEVTRLMTAAQRTPENVELMLDMIRRVQTVDQECVNWMSNLPDLWRFKTVGWEDHVPNGDYEKAEVFPGRVDLYPDLYMASVYNMVRTSRLILASVLVRCAAWVCAPVDYRTTPEYATAARSCVDTITDIIASVPFHLGWHLKRPEIQQKHDLSGFACGEEDCMKGLAGYFLTWPLMCINGQDYATDAQRAWCTGRLKYIANELGVRYAGLLSGIKIRIPSMLIRRDGMMAQPNGMSGDFVKLASSRKSRSASPTANKPLQPLQQKESPGDAES